MAVNNLNTDSQPGVLGAVNNALNQAGQGAAAAGSAGAGIDPYSQIANAAASVINTTVTAGFQYGQTKLLTDLQKQQAAYAETLNLAGMGYSGTGYFGNALNNTSAALANKYSGGTFLSKLSNPFADNSIIFIALGVAALVVALVVLKPKK